MFSSINKYFHKLVKAFNELVKAFNDFLIDIGTDSLGHASTTSSYILIFFKLYYENFLLVILCKFDLDWLKFGVAQWLLCNAVLFCCFEAASGVLHIWCNICDLYFALWSDGYVDVMNLFKSFFNNFWSVEKYSTYYHQPPLPKDPHVLTTLNNIEPIESVNNTESIESVNKVETTRSNPHVKRPYSIYAIAFGLIYLGIVVSSYGS